MLKKEKIRIFSATDQGGGESVRTFLYILNYIKFENCFETQLITVIDVSFNRRMSFKKQQEDYFAENPFQPLAKKKSRTE